MTSSAEPRYGAPPPNPNRGHVCNPRCSHPDPADCRHPDHKRPPGWFHMPPDLHYHVCPECGMERWLDTRPQP